MNTIIIYSSKYGSTADCAKYLKSGLSGSVSLYDIDKVKPQTINLESFDTIIIGSSIYVGKVSKKTRALCNEYSNLLCNKKLGIFLCCGFQEQADEYFSTNFPADLLKHAISIKTFGGEARLEKMKTVDKLIMKAATKGNYKDLQISRENMDDFIRAIEA